MIKTRNARMLVQIMRIRPLKTLENARMVGEPNDWNVSTIYIRTIVLIQR